MSDLIDVYARRLKAAGRSDRTISVRTRVLRHADRALPSGLDKASDEEIVNYLARVTNRWSRTTYYSHLRGYYRTMAKAGRLTLDPMADLPRPRGGDRTPDPVSCDELALALDGSPDQPWRTAVYLASYAGLRCAELCELEREDVTRQDVFVRHGKGDKARYVPTHPLIWDLVRDRGPGRLVVSKAGRPFTPDQLSARQQVHWRRLGLPAVHLHRFRHWFGTTLADNGVGIEVIRELMGHESIEMTRCYIRVSTARRAAAMLALPTIGEHQPERSRLVPTAA